MHNIKSCKKTHYTGKSILLKYKLGNKQTVPNWNRPYYAWPSGLRR